MSTATMSDVNARQAGGLSSEEATRRLALDGRNVVAEGRRRSVALELFAKLRNPLLLLLLGAAIVAGVTGDARSCTVIVVLVVLSVVMDFVQERRAGDAAERLGQAARSQATVLRDGVPRDIAASEVVPGDVLVLSAGDLVAADAHLLEARDLFANQALLTGEPFPVEKQARATIDAPAAPADAPGSVFMGTSIVSGSARAVVVATGARTVLGQIGVSLRRTPPPSAFEHGTRAFGGLILRFATVMVLFVLLVSGWRGRPWLDSFLFAIALAVGLAPELLPMIVSVTLSRGAIRMSRRKVLVKRLAAIHDLGSMDVLCTDKTGTLTEAHIRLEQHLDARGSDSARVLELAYLNSNFQSGLRSPLDEAILGHEAIDVSAWHKLDELPFDFERRCVSVLVARDDEPPLLVTKGAFEDLLARCTRFEAEGGALAQLDPGLRETLVARFTELGNDGLRVLAVAFRPAPSGTTAIARDDETDLVFAGFATFMDPPKAGARETLASLAELGIAVKVLTGDNERVAAHVAAALAIPAGELLTGGEIQAMDDQALDARVERTTLFCRVTPAEKNRVLLSLKRRGRVVGFLGDGINDAPALHTADVGISVDGAVDVAKEAADLILLEHDLGVLRDGVLEGRRTLGNIIKYILMGTSSNFGNMFSMAGAAAFLPFLPMLPIQILVNNFLYDLTEVPIPTDTVDEEFVRRPHRWDMAFIRKFMLAIGPVSSAFDFLTFWILYAVLHASAPLFQTGWFMESLATQVLVIFVIRTRRNPFKSRPSLAVVLTCGAVLATAFALPFTALGHALGFVSPPARLFAMLPPIVAAYLLAVEMVKRLFYARLERSAP